MKLSTTKMGSRIEQFESLVRDGVELWVKAGELLVKMVEEDPTVYDQIIERNPSLDRAVLGRFEMMGRKMLHPRLLMNGSPGYKRLRRMPFSVQEKFVESSVELLVVDGGKPDTLLVDARHLTPKQAAQVFSENGVRTLGEQRAYLADMRRNAQPMDDDRPAWRVRGGKVEFMAGVKLTAGELATILAQITK